MRSRGVGRPSTAARRGAGLARVALLVTKPSAPRMPTRYQTPVPRGQAAPCAPGGALRRPVLLQTLLTEVLRYDPLQVQTHTLNIRDLWPRFACTAAAVDLPGSALLSNLRFGTGLLFTALVTVKTSFTQSPPFQVYPKGRLKARKAFVNVSVCLSVC